MENKETVTNIHQNTGQTFSEAFNKFHRIARREIKAEIIELTDWSDKTFYNKMSGESPIRPAERAVIGLVFQCHGIDAWTSKELN